MLVSSKSRWREEFAQLARGGCPSALCNVAYHAVISDDTIIPCWKDLGGTFHLNGDPLLAPPKMINLFVRNSTPCTVVVSHRNIVEEEFQQKIVSSSIPVWNKLLTNGLLRL